MKLLEKLRGLFGPRKKPGRPAGAKKPAPQKKPLKIAGPDAKLTAAEKRRVKRSIQKAQRDGKIPRDAVQTIPYRELFPDGLMQVNDKLFTKTLRFSDINYELAQPEDKEQTFDGLCDFYNALDSSMWAQMSFLNLRANLIDYRKSVTVPGQGDGCDDVRRELETILQAQLAKGNNGLIKRKYFTFGIEADSGQAARPRVERIEADLRNHLKNMGVRSEPLSGYDRLEVLHGIFHPDGREKLRFNWDAVVNTGLSTKPFIAPSSFDFRGGRTFKIGGMWGAASFLQIGASQLNDRVLSDFLNLDCSQIVTIHIKAVNQQEAIKTIKRKLTDIEKTKIEEQKKAVRSGYDMDVLPPDLITYAGEAQTLLNSLQSRDERMFLATVLIVNLAPTRGQLENDVFQAASVAQKHNCALKRLDWQQEQGLMSSLPLGLNQIEIQRGLTTSSLAIFVPFTTEELFMDGEALYYGINALSSNLIMADRKRLKNPNGLFLGVPGSGKSFSAKREIANAFLTTKDDIIITDPEAEYAPLVNRLGGQVVQLSPVSTQYVNPMDINPDYSDEENPLTLKSDFMGRQFDRVSAELVQVRGQLAELQQSPVKKALSAAVTGLEKGVHAARERLAAVKEQIAEGAARAVEEVKHAGLAGLNKAVSFLGVKKTLNLLRGDLHNTVTDAKATIAKVEAVGEELRSVGGHLKQAGRATVGKERQEVDASKEGRFQAGLLAPLRSFRDIVEHMEQSAGKAVGQLEKLEQAAARKPSVLDNLKKAEKPEKAAPAPKRAEPEAAL